MTTRPSSSVLQDFIRTFRAAHGEPPETGSNGTLCHGQTIWPSDMKPFARSAPSCGQRRECDDAPVAQSRDAIVRIDGLNFAVGKLVRKDCRHRADCLACNRPAAASGEAPHRATEGRCCKAGLEDCGQCSERTKRTFCKPRIFVAVVVLTRKMGLVECHPKADDESRLVGTIQLRSVQLIRMKENAIAGFKVEGFWLAQRHIVRHTAFFSIILGLPVFLDEDGQPIALADSPERDPDVDAIVGAVHVAHGL